MTTRTAVKYRKRRARTGTRRQQWAETKPPVRDSLDADVDRYKENGMWRRCAWFFISQNERRARRKTDRHDRAYHQTRQQVRGLHSSVVARQVLQY